MLKDKVAVITGSTSGIGLGIAEAFASQGCKVILNGLSPAEEVKSTEERLRQTYGAQVAYFPADLSQAEACKGLIAHALKTFGSIDILVNNAGVQHVSCVEDFSPQKWDLILALNLSSAFHTVQHALPEMHKKGWGRIINIASAHGLVASVHKAAYVAAKHGLVGFTKVVALETAETGITANCICPGWVLTPLVQAQIDKIAKEENLSPEAAKSKLLLEKQPSGEFVTVQQLGQTALFLASEGAAQVRGIALSVDGGWVAR